VTSQGAPNQTRNLAKDCHQHGLLGLHNAGWRVFTVWIGSQKLRRRVSRIVAAEIQGSILAHPLVSILELSDLRVCNEEFL
jgi:G:T-mismatch repair DNA endonuclease (very short patch repair protein)